MLRITLVADCLLWRYSKGAGAFSSWADAVVEDSNSRSPSNGLWMFWNSAMDCFFYRNLMDPPLTKCIIKLGAEFEKHWLGWDVLAWDDWCWWIVPSHPPLSHQFSHPHWPFLPSHWVLDACPIAPCFPYKPNATPAFHSATLFRLSGHQNNTWSALDHYHSQVKLLLKPYTWFQRDRCDRIGGERINGWLVIKLVQQSHSWEKRQAVYRAPGQQWHSIPTDPIL